MEALPEVSVKQRVVALSSTPTVQFECWQHCDGLHGTFMAWMIKYMCYVFKVDKQAKGSPVRDRPHQKT